MARSIARLFLCVVVVAPLSPAPAQAQTTLSGGVVGALYRRSESFELPGIGALLGELGDIEHQARPGADVALGHRLSPMLRGQVSLAWRRRGTMSASVGQLRNASTIGSYALFLDGILDVPQWRAGPATPYVTAGGGMTWNRYHDQGTGLPGAPPLITTDDNTDTYFAWRAGGGVSVAVRSAWALDVGWRYADYANAATGTHFRSTLPGIIFVRPLPQAPVFTLASHEITIGIRRELGAPAAAPPLGVGGGDRRGLYVRFDAGKTSGLDPGLTINALDFPLIVDFNPSYHVTAGAGYRWSPRWRADLTVAAMPSLRQYSYQRAEPIGAADLSSVAVMASGYYDIGQFGALTPYAGAGLGPSWNRYGDLEIAEDPTSVGASIPGRTTVHLAWQVGGGVSTDLAFGWSVDVGYQYVARGDYTNEPIAYLTNGRIRTDLQSTGRIVAHEMHIGLRRRF